MSPVEAWLGDIQAVLDRLGQALASASLDDLLAVEASLASVLERTPAQGAREVGRTDDIRKAAFRATASLMRCRRLGASLAGFAVFCMHTMGASGYDRSGQSAVWPSPTEVNERT